MFRKDVAALPSERKVCGCEWRVFAYEIEPAHAVRALASGEVDESLPGPLEVLH
jgi:hypothetical protein